MIALYLCAGSVMIAAGVLFIVFRERIVAWSKQSQKRTFGEGAARFQSGQTPNSMIAAGVIVIVAGGYTIVTAAISLFP